MVWIFYGLASLLQTPFQSSHCWSACQFCTFWLWLNHTYTVWAHGASLNVLHTQTLRACSCGLVWRYGTSQGMRRERLCPYILTAKFTELVAILLWNHFFENRWLRHGMGGIHPAAASVCFPASDTTFWQDASIPIRKELAWSQLSTWASSDLSSAPHSTLFVLPRISFLFQFVAVHSTDQLPAQILHTFNLEWWIDFLHPLAETSLAQELRELKASYLWLVCAGG